MSALPPKADMCGAARDVRFGPKADIGVTQSRPRSAGGAAARRVLTNDFPDLVDAVAFRHNYPGAVFELALQHKLRLAV
jgi:hypothetical protein